MTTRKAWGNIGAWAADAEAAEAEERSAAAAQAADSQSFPSLKEAASTKPKKKKPAAMSLSEFHSASSTESRALTPDEMMRLPTGPRQRTQEELDHGRGGLGGGFRSYGLGRRDDVGGAGGGRRPYGGFEDEPMRRGPPPPSGSDFEQMPSRADEVDNWASMKKPLAPPPSAGIDSGRYDRYDALSGRGGPSRADEVDNWSSVKKPLSSRYSGFGSGFRDSALSDSDRWGRGTGPMPTMGDRERPRLVLDPPKGDGGASTESVKVTRPSPFGAARPREDILAEKGVDWRRMEAEIEIKKMNRPTSSNSSRPSSAQSSRTQSPPRQLGVTEVVVKPRPKVNPFGDAKPREVVLQEQGKDWKKIDFELEHRGVDRPETEQERMLKEEISHLNELLAKETQTNQNGEVTRFSAEELDDLRQRRENMERELEHLAHELDDKVRFGQKASGDRRPGSGSGRLNVFSDRPSSQSGMSEDSRSMEFTERPRSRGGAGDIWGKVVDDRRSFQLGTEGGFLDNRNMDRSRSRERW